MSENKPAQERTEQPTPRRLKEAREKGQVARSRELNTMMVMLTGAVALLLSGGWIVAGLGRLLGDGLVRSGAPHLEAQDVPLVMAELAGSALMLLVPLLGLLMVAVFAGPALLGGLVFSADALRPKLERLSVLRGLKRIFSAQGLMELFKTLLKFSLLTGTAAALLWWLADDFLALGRQSPIQGMMNLAGMIQLVFLILAGGLILVAAVDAPFQLWTHLRQLRMTRQEVKDELKESEGNPELRARLRRVQQEIAGRRMMQEVPRADVVITNPTHFAVALRYTDHPDRAPRVVTKGRDLVAVRIRELAGEHAVPVCSAPPLARAIYFTTELGAEIPAGLYLAVARVLAWVMQLRTATRTGGPMPGFPEDLPIPAALARDAGGVQ